MNRKKRTNGFTLAELLLVVVILGILASIALPRFFPQAEKSRVAEALGMLSAIRQGEESFFLENGTYLDNPTTAADWAQLGMNDPDLAAGDGFFDYTVTVGGVGTIFSATATRTGNSDSMGQSGNTITINQNGTYGGTHPFVPG